MSRPIDKMRHSLRQGTERYLLLDENRFAHAAIEQLARQSNKTPPQSVFVSGPAGCGKSLLARRFARLELSARPKVQMAHVTASEFAAELAEASERGVVPQFQERYRSLAVLVLEDVRSLHNRSQTMQQLGFLLDVLRANGGRVLLTSGCPPGELKGMTPRLINRFHAGVCAVVRPLGYASRVALLQHFAQTRQIPVSHDAACLLARELPVSARELLATLTQLEEAARQSNTDLDQNMIQRYVEREIKPTTPTLSQITRAVARRFSTTAAAIRGHSRKQSLILPRQCAIFLVRSLTDLSLAKIAGYFGDRHHSSIAHACERIKLAKDEQPGVRQHLAQIRQSLEMS